MTSNPYRIIRQWHDVTLYDEGDGRSIEFDCPSLIEPRQMRATDGS